MATVEKTVELIFAGVDGVTPSLKTIKGSLAVLDAAAQAVATPFAKLFDAVVKADAALAIMAGATVAAAIIQAGKLGDSFNEISTLVTASDADLAAFEAQIITYGRSSTASFEEIHGAVYTAISAGTDYKNSLDLVATAEKLATAGRGDLDSTTRLMAATLNAYGAETDEATRYSDAMFQTVKDGLTTLPELADNLGKVATDAALAKVPIETLGASIAGLTAAGLDTTVATTGLKALLKSIVDPSDQAAAAAKALGIEFSGASLASDGLEGILRQVQAATGGNVDQLKLLFDNTRAYTAAAILSSDQSGTFARALENQANKAGVLDEAFGKMARNFDQINQTTMNNLQATLAQVGAPLLDQYKSLADALAAVAGAMGASITAGDMDPMFDALNGWGESLETWLQDVAQALPEALAGVDLSGFLGALQQLGTDFGAIFDGLDLTTPQGLQSALQVAVDGLELLVNMTRGIVQELTPIAQTVTSILGYFIDMSDESQVALGRASAVGKLVKEFGIGIGLAAAAVGQSGLTLAMEQVTGSTEEATRAMLAHQERLSALRGEATPLLPILQEEVAKLDAIKLAAEGGAPALGALADSTESLADAASGPGISDYAANLAKVEAVAGSTESQIAELDAIVAQAADSLQREADASRASAAGMQVASTGAEDLSTALIETVADSDTLRLGMAKLATDLAGQTYKANIDLQVAQVQADAATITATMNALASNFSASSSVVSGLFGQLGGAISSGSGYLQQTLQIALQTQLSQQAQAHQMTMALTQAQIDALNARTALIQQGGGLIQIDGTGLAPALQMVMWEIIEEVQLRVNASAADFLLGVT